MKRAPQSPGLLESRALFWWTDVVAPLAGVAGVAVFASNRTGWLWGWLGAGCLLGIWGGLRMRKAEEGRPPAGWLEAATAVVWGLWGIWGMIDCPHEHNFAFPWVPGQGPWMDAGFWLSAGWFPKAYATVARWGRRCRFERRHWLAWLVFWALAMADCVALFWWLTQSLRDFFAILSHLVGWAMWGGLLFSAMAMAWLAANGTAWARGKRTAGAHCGAWRMVMALLFGLALPLLGLALNATVRPRYLFETTHGWLWGMAVTSGLLLLPPSRRSGWLGLAAWWGRWVAAPFTVYFFLRFLPGLWMVPVAWFAGFGFASAEPILEGALYCAPFLMFQHWQKDVAELWNALLWEYGPWRLAAAAFAGAWVLPVWALWQVFGAK